MNSICDDKAFCSTASKYISEFPRSDTMVSSRSLFAALKAASSCFRSLYLQCSENVSSQKMYNRGICFLKVPLIKLFQGILELSIPAKIKGTYIQFQPVTSSGN